MVHIEPSELLSPPVTKAAQLSSMLQGFKKKDILSLDTSVRKPTKNYNIKYTLTDFRCTDGKDKLQNLLQEKRFYERWLTTESAEDENSEEQQRNKNNKKRFLEQKQ